MPDSPTPQRPPTPPRPPGTLRIGSIAGAEVRVASSWFLVAALIAVVVEPRIEQVQPGLGPWKFVAGVAFAVILYLAILLHEASHAVVARRFGAQVSSITLHFLGGMTAVEGESRSPKQEFWVAVVGPLTSIAVGLVSLGAWFLVPPGLVRVGIEGMAGANLLIGVLNLLPAMPLDGGRVLMSGVWKITGNRHRGSLVAGWAGRVLAILVLGWPWLLAAFTSYEPDLVDLVLAFVLALFLWGGASQTIAHAQLMQQLPMLRVRDLARRATLVDEATPLGLAVAQAQQQQAGSIVTTTAGGSPVGIVKEAALLAVPEERRPWMPVSAVTRTLDEGLVLPLEAEGEQLIRAIGRHPASEYLVVDPAGAIHGVLATSDVDRAFRQRRN